MLFLCPFVPQQCNPGDLRALRKGMTLYHSESQLSSLPQRQDAMHMVSTQQANTHPHKKGAHIHRVWLCIEMGFNCTQAHTDLIVGRRVLLPPQWNQVKSALIHFTAHAPIIPPHATSLSLTWQDVRHTHTYRKKARRREV